MTHEEASQVLETIASVQGSPSEVLKMKRLAQKYLEKSRQQDGDEWCDKMEITDLVEDFGLFLFVSASGEK